MAVTVSKAVKLLGVALTIAILLLLAPAAWAQHHGGMDPRAVADDPASATGPIAPLLEGLGDLTHPVTTSSPRAQRFFDQGLRLTYGFNHQEALRAFKEVARLDPDCAMAYWGWALVLGPNINLPMQADVADQAYQAISMAMARRDKASQRERDYIEALATRYAKDPPADRTSLDRAYADAMRALHQKYPDDDDAATLYVSALMNLSPWNYWTKDAEPRPGTRDAERALEEVIARNPRHIGALHYYIHLIEPVDPKRAEPAADRLRGLTPGAGHLVHMPSHIYIQVGRYAEAAAANVLAVKADEGYVTQCRAQGIYPLNYYPHNIHFLFWARMMQGKSADALAAARKAASRIPADQHGDDWAVYQTILSTPLFAMARFGHWSEILAEPEPPSSSTYWHGVWLWARGLAELRSGHAERAQAQLAALDAVASNPRTAEQLVGYSNGARVLTIASNVLAGEIDAAARRYDAAIVHLDRAVRLQDGLQYTEPPDWYYPVRHNLGAVLLEAGRPEEAETVYWQDLRQFPENGYSLFGLSQTLRAEGRKDEAAAIEARFEKAWAESDVKLDASRF
jgi:tetratricopeptide (TPR) repeat protein